jgi:hypothetical protein
MPICLDILDRLEHLRVPVQAVQAVQPKAHCSTNGWPTVSASNFVTLRGALIVPRLALDLALDLEQRGCHLVMEPVDDVLVVGPRELLTDEDRAQIRKFRNHLKAIATYEAPTIQ